MQSSAEFLVFAKNSENPDNGKNSENPDNGKNSENPDNGAIDSGWTRPPADAVLGTPNILPYPKFTGVLSGIDKV